MEQKLVLSIKAKINLMDNKKQQLFTLGPAKALGLTLLTKIFQAQILLV